MEKELLRIHLELINLKILTVTAMTKACIFQIQKLKKMEAVDEVLGMIEDRREALLINKETLLILQDARDSLRSKL